MSTPLDESFSRGEFFSSQLDSPNRAHASLIRDLADIAPARRPGDRLIGSARWDGATGEYLLTYGESRRSTTSGVGSAVNMIAAIARHGYRTDRCESIGNGSGVRCDLYELDWSRA